MSSPKIALSNFIINALALAVTGPEVSEDIGVSALQVAGFRNIEVTDENDGTISITLETYSEDLHVAAFGTILDEGHTLETGRIGKRTDPRSRKISTVRWDLDQSRRSERKADRKAAKKSAATARVGSREARAAKSAEEAKAAKAAEEAKAAKAAEEAKAAKPSRRTSARK